jgi:hypothetical protein
MTGSDDFGPTAPLRWAGGLLLVLLILPFFVSCAPSLPRGKLFLIYDATKDVVRGQAEFITRQCAQGLASAEECDRQAAAYASLTMINEEVRAVIAMDSTDLDALWAFLAQAARWVANAYGIPLPNVRPGVMPQGGRMIRLEPLR